MTGDAGLYRLPELWTVFLAEALAIREALRYVATNNISHATILTDSLSVLFALQSSTPTATTHHILVDIRLAGLDPELCWVPAHVGTVLPDTGTSLLLITVNSLTGYSNLVINPIFGLLSSRAIQNIPDMMGYL